MFKNITNGINADSTTNRDTHMKNFKPNLIKAALITSGFAFGATAPVAMAQEAEADDTEVIQVTGIRGSLMRAQAIKMDSTSIVEALSAEDIGKLPDTSVAESLARLPGLAGERRNGRTSGLSVRGFNENYIGTSLNGRELLGMGDNRGVEFDLYPTEIVSNILVYKSPEAGLLVQGVGGTVDLQTVKPLGMEQSFTINGTYEKNAEDSANPDFDNTGHRLSFNYVDSFADDTLGLALTIATMESPRQENQFRGWGYATVNTGADRRATDTAAAPDGTLVLGGHDSFARSAVLERTSAAAVLQWAPSDDLMVQMDMLYIDFEENDVKRGLEEGGAEWGVGSNYDIFGVDNGLVTSGAYDGFHSVVRNDARKQDADLLTLGLNISYQINDDWTATVDFSSGSVDKTITDIESYSGVGRAGIDGRPLTARAWEMTSSGAVFSNHPTIAPVDLTDASLIRLAGPQAWGAPIIGSDAQDGFVNEPIFSESLDSLRVEVEGAVEWGVFTNLEVGINYSDRQKSKINGGAYLTAPDYPGDAAIPDPVGIVSLDFIGINGIIGYDSLGLYNSGYYTATDAGRVQNDRLGDTYEVFEELTTVYGKLDIDTEVGDIFIRGNVGLQVVSSDQTSTGFSTTSNAQGFTVFVPVEGGDDYTDVLPSLNLMAEVAENQIVRLGLSKVITRPRMDDMRPNTQANFAFNDNQILSTDPANGPWSGSRGNPNLKPLEAAQFDLAYENYFADDGYFAVSYFYKDIQNWHRDASAIVDFSDVYIPELHQTSDGQAPATFLGGVGSVSGGYEGSVSGYEIQGSIPLSMLHDSLEGFGIYASATFMDGDIDPSPGSTDTRVPGLSDESYSFTAYYESNGFEIRISGTKRDPFLTEQRGLSLALVSATDQGGELWDAQIGYDFSESGIESLEGLRVTLQAQNLTDEETVQTANEDARLITQHQAFGANYLLGFNYSF